MACPQLYQRLVVGSDGQVMMCSNDENNDHVVGNAYTQTIKEIWHGPLLNEVRKVHARQDGFKCFGICKHCYYPRKSEPDEKAKVCDREIWVENYVNRAQEVGS